MAAVTNNSIPEKTIERLSEYRRSLLACLNQGITHIFSHILADMHGITAVQVRRDLMLIGFSSDTKKGYDIKVLVEFINGILDSKEVMNVAVIGMGRLGQAITSYFNGKRRQLRIVAAFDIDTNKVNSSIDEIPCYHLDQLVEKTKELNISIVIISSPTSVAHSLVEPIVEAKIHGVLNFTSAPLNFPDHIVAENYDITTILEKVAYFVKESDAMRAAEVQ